ncbi:MAG: hypothetical protein IJ635_07655 [Bacteroidaceae bacterium]|nr:hypothetical protein [Bacteroidaceae bacterium]MBR1521099.1 hypothetical protein [Bacteroidaceae bacterium]
MVLIKRLAPLFCILIGMVSCSDDATSTYSKREYVYCYFSVLQYTELFNVMGNYGQFATIRKRVVNGATKITMTSTGSSTDYTADALSANFGLGLGGLIVGTNHYGETLCYDLACPICDRADRRLSLSDNGYAKCSKCGTTFDMNNYGAIYEVSEDNPPATHRGLYRYRVRYDGQIVNAYN